MELRLDTNSPIAIHFFLGFVGLTVGVKEDYYSNNFDVLLNLYKVKPLEHSRIFKEFSNRVLLTDLSLGVPYQTDANKDLSEGFENPLQVLLKDTEVQPKSTYFLPDDNAEQFGQKEDKKKNSPKFIFPLDFEPAPNDDSERSTSNSILQHTNQYEPYNNPYGNQLYVVNQLRIAGIPEVEIL